MSLQTEEFRSLLVELNADLFDGLQCIIRESAATSIDPDANAPGASTLRTFDPATQTYDQAAAQAAGGAERATASAVLPADQTRAALLSGGAAEGASLLVVPTVFRDDGSQLIPKPGMTVELLGRLWQIDENGVTDLIFGDGVFGHEIRVAGGGNPWA